MKLTFKYLIIFVATFMLRGQALAQNVVGDNLRLKPSTLPLTCNIGDLRTDAADGYKLKQCVSNIWSQVGSSGTAAVLSLNGLQGALSLVAGTGISLGLGASTDITISATGGGGANLTAGQVLFGDGTPTPVSDPFFTYNATTSTVGTYNLNVTGTLTLPTLSAAKVLFTNATGAITTGGLNYVSPDLYVSAGQVYVSSGKGLYLNGYADANWGIGRDINTWTNSHITGDSVAISIANDTVGGVSFGLSGNTPLFEVNAAKEAWFYGNVNIGSGNLIVTPGVGVFSSLAVTNFLNVTTTITSLGSAHFNAINATGSEVWTGPALFANTVSFTAAAPLTTSASLTALTTASFSGPTSFAGATKFTGNITTALTTAGPVITDANGLLSSEAALAVARGGTNNATLSVASGGVLYTDGAKVMNAGTAASGAYFSSGTVPSWLTFTAHRVINLAPGSGIYTPSSTAKAFWVRCVGPGGGGGGAALTSGTQSSGGGGGGGGGYTERLVTAPFGANFTWAVGAGGGAGAAGGGGNNGSAATSFSNGTVVLNAGAGSGGPAGGAATGPVFASGAGGNGGGAAGGDLNIIGGQGAPGIVLANGQQGAGGGGGSQLSPAQPSISNNGNSNGSSGTGYGQGGGGATNSSSQSARAGSPASSGACTIFEFFNGN